MLVFLSAGAFLVAQDTKNITAEGVATITTDPAAARDKAIEDALRRAVEQAVGSMVESETAIENYQLLSDKIYSHSSGYVKNFDVVSEKREGNLLRVTVSASVSSGDLSSELGAIGLLQRRMKNPRVMIMIAEDNILKSDFWQLYSVSNSQSESVVMAAFKAKGFNVVDPNYLRKTVTAPDAKAAWSGNYDVAGRVGRKLGAEVVIVGQAISTRAPNTIAGSDLLSVSSSINATAVKAATGEVLAQASGQGTAAHINEVAALQQSMQKASEKVADSLISGILLAWKEETSGTRNLVMEVQDVTEPELEKVKSALLKLRGVTDVLIRNFSEGSADLNIQARSDAQELSTLISQTRFTGFRLVLVDSSADHLEYRVAH